MLDTAAAAFVDAAHAARCLVATMLRVVVAVAAVKRVAARCPLSRQLTLVRDSIF